MAHAFRRSLSASVSVLVSVSVAFLGVPPAMAQTGTSWGSGGSITTQAVDADTGQPVSMDNLKLDQKVRIVVRAFDSYGRQIDCGTPAIGVINGVSGNQLIQTGPDTIKGGPGFGTAEITVKCPNLPDVQYKAMTASQGRPLGGARPQAAQAQPQPQAQNKQAPAAASGGAGVGTALVIGGLVLAGAAAAAAGAGGGGSSSSSAASCSSGQFCRTTQGKTGCCPSGGFIQLCQNSNACADISPFTGGSCPGGEEKHANCCGGPVDCGINK